MSMLAVIDWNSLLHHDPGMPFFLVGLAIGGFVSVTAIVAVQWRKAQQTSYEATLKAKMIDRGFSADEIIKVVGVSTAPRRKHRHQAPFFREPVMI